MKYQMHSELKAILSHYRVAADAALEEVHADTDTQDDYQTALENAADVHIDQIEQLFKREGYIQPPQPKR